MSIDKEKVFKYLDTLRETGVTNMWGAGSWVENAFAVDRMEASELLQEWMKTFEERHSTKGAS